MRKIYKQGVLALAISSLLVTSSCGNLESLNTDTKAYEQPIAEALMSKAQQSSNYFLHNASVNDNNFRKYAQQWTSSTYFDEDIYNQEKRDLGSSYFSSFYIGVLPNLYDAKKFIELQETFSSDELAVKNNKLAIIEIQIVNAYMTLVDIFGDVPYSEAIDLLNFPTPKYDDAETIYLDLVDRITLAINSLDTTNGSFGNADLINKGNVSKWKKLANSIKLKMALHLYDIDASKSKQLAEEAYASGVIDNNADNSIMFYMPNTNEANPAYTTLVEESSLIPTSYLIQILSSKQDPRLDVFLDPTSKVGGQYLGASYAQGGVHANLSTQGTKIKAQDSDGIIFDYAETSFLLAEAASRGFSVGGNAATHYENGIKASMNYWGVSTADTNTYLARTDVAFSTAQGTDIQKIAQQLWIAYYNRGFEAWTEYRRLDYPILTAPINAVNDAQGKVPTRVIYPSSSRVNNKANYEAAAAKIGGDKMTTKIFWDVN
ncbi:SusD/RagB family nutrient-binding outer membrane lipoprotein [Tenacibaculum aestuariivivum]|uniref:SusD/RagB family nutrient-binding outer membrane lipoprotein n=1 Tax=Tenacibaculum aestuariivivum TaxID=2006131 RepID=UPI003AB6964C